MSQLFAYLIAFLLPLASMAVPPPPGRASSAPFISGDTFRAFADYVYDELDITLDPKTVQPSSVIFVKTDLLGDFFTHIHPHIPVRYILLSHNSDHLAPGPYAPFLNDPKLIAWFAQNYDGTNHAKMHPIPIGIANFHWPHGNFQAIQRVAAKRLAKTHLAYMNIAIQTFHEERWRVFKHFATEAYCYRTPKKEYERFLYDVASSKFTIAPRGNGLDTHRLWEALYLGSIPIVQTSSLDSLYRELPVLIVPNWDDVTEEMLEMCYASIAYAVESIEKLTMDYWARRINSCR